MSRTLAAFGLAALIVAVGVAGCGPQSTEPPPVPTAPVFADTVPTEIVATPVEPTAAVTRTAGLTTTTSLTTTGGITATGAVTATSVLTNAVDLEGTAWALFAMGDPVKPTRVLTTTTVMIAFAGGQVTGNTGCTAFNASFVVLDATMRISPPVLAGAGCTDPAQKAQETAFLAALPATASWRGDELRLDLVSSDGKSVLQFVRSIEATP